MWSLFPPQHQTTDKGHGRIEIRQIWTSTDLNEYLDFPYVKQVFCIRRDFTYIKTGKISEETVYGITSIEKEKAAPDRLLDLNRGHWSIENRLHYVRDVTFDEDRSQIRSKNAPKIMATFRNFAISLFRSINLNNIAKALRTFAAKPLSALSLIGL
ncbi:MAG: ISAs1 family transposase [Candidatus Scalindua sp.]